MRARPVHRLLGLILLLPICGWVATGFVFFLKPGYRAAYGIPRIRELPLTRLSISGPRTGWLEARALRTVLGEHLLVRTEAGWTHLDPSTLEPLGLPDEAGIRHLVGDAVSADRARYGDVARIVRREGASPSASIETTTGVTIDLDWTTLALGQSGRDTRLIDALYRVHYLQWTGIAWLDRVLGAAALVSLLTLALLGLRLALTRPPA